MRAPTQKRLLLRVLLNGASDLTQASLEALPEKDREILSDSSLKKSDLEPLVHQYRNTLPKIHYSWLQTYLAKLDPVKKQGLVSCLGEAQRLGLSRLNQNPPPTPITSPFLRQFYLAQLYPLIPLREHLPIEYLPESPLNALLELKKSELLELIDLLGLYDLAHEMRQTLATKNLKNLYMCLSAKQQQFLRSCLHQRDKIVTPPLNLKEWNGECSSLFRLLHRRGLARMALALSGRHEDLIWYLCHFLDVGRGELLQKQIPQEEVPYLTQAVALQIETAKNFLRQG